VHERLTWDEAKRRSNLLKHGLDFVNATTVLDSRYRFDVTTVRHGETRVQSFSYVMGRLAVLTVVHVQRSEELRIIVSGLPARRNRKIYYEWLAEEAE
jgi:uncharacterized DUF497 family protein